MLGCIRPEHGQPEVRPTEDAKTTAKLILITDPSIYLHIKEQTTSKGLWNKLKVLYDE